MSRILSKNELKKETIIIEEKEKEALVINFDWKNKWLKGNYFY